MKNSIIVLMLFISNLSTAQIDIGADASFAGVFTGVKVSYPIEDQFIVGGSYSYNVSNRYIESRFDLVLGYKVDEWFQVEADAGFMHGYYDSFDYVNNKRSFITHVDLGAKIHFLDNVFFELKISFPGFIRAGLGFRLRPYKKLTTWDKQ